MLSVLPNMRLLGLHSNVGGRDFDELTRQIDSSRETLGYDLADESIFLFYSEFPHECRVARSVTGPVKKVADYELWDWVTAPVQTVPLTGNSWAHLEEELEAIGPKLICVRLSRRIKNGELQLSCESIVHD